jgi:hypothetical protein
MEVGMEPISALAISLALGAAATAGKEVISAIVKDAYGKLKALIESRYPGVSLVQLEKAPESASRRAVVEEELTTFGAGQDAELLAAGHRLAELIQHHKPRVAASLGVNLKDVVATNLRLADIAASGIGVSLEHGTFKGDIDIRGIRAGVPPTGTAKGD